MGQGQSGQAGFPGQGPPGEKKDQVSPSGSAFSPAGHVHHRETCLETKRELIDPSRHKDGHSPTQWFLRLCVPIAEQGEEEVGASTASA